MDQNPGNWGTARVPNPPEATLCAADIKNQDVRSDSSGVVSGSVEMMLKI